MRPKILLTHESPIRSRDTRNILRNPCIRGTSARTRSLHRGIADSQESPRGIADSQNPHCHHFAAEWVRYSSATYKQHKKETKKPQIPHFTERVYRSRDQCDKLSCNPSWSTHARVIDRMTNFTECVVVAVITARSCVPIACSWKLQKLQKCNPPIQYFRRRTPAEIRQALRHALQPSATIKITVGYKILICLTSSNPPIKYFRRRTPAKSGAHSDMRFGQAPQSPSPWDTRFWFHTMLQTESSIAARDKVGKNTQTISPSDTRLLSNS